MTKEIQLTQGKVTLVDDADYDYLTQWKWYVIFDGSNWYAMRSIHSPETKNKKTTIYMHRVIVGAKKIDVVDHCDGNSLNNQRSNLRLCNAQQNRWNQGPAPTNRSGYKGVYWEKKIQKYVATIRLSNKRTYLGSYTDPVLAARAYDKKAKEVHGEFARLNFPES
jgi:hypothetical protein